MTPKNEHKDHSGAGDIMDSTVEFGYAATKFAMDQVGTALRAVTSPGRAIDHIKRSMDNFSTAMNASVEGEEAVEKETQAHEESVAAEGAFTGRKT